MEYFILSAEGVESKDAGEPIDCGDISGPFVDFINVKLWIGQPVDEGETVVWPRETDV